MGVPAAIALYASPPSSMCSTAHQISSHVSYDLEVNARSTSSTAQAQKPLVGGLSCLFSSSSPHQIKSDELGSSSSSSSSLLWHDKADELSSSFRYLSSSSKRDQSPVSVLQGPVSRSPPIRSYGSGGGMFGGLARHASLGSYAVDCDDSCTRDVDLSYVSSSVVSGDDHLTFSMEEGVVDVDLPVYARELLFEARSGHSVFEDEVVVRAFCEAEKAHRGQKRASGHPYLQHCVETAVLLADIGANPTVVAVGLLHDTLDDCSVTYDHVSGMFGAEVADLVEGVSKLSQLSKLARENNTASKTAEADRLHTMFLTMADARAVLIKLADRLHNMLTLDALPLIKQQRFAKETLEIFAPLANRLGISTWKEQLENLSFRHLNPDHHRELSSKLVDSFDEAVMSSSLEKLEQALKSGGISYHSLSGRHKSLYSIYSKMMKKKLDMDEIHDIHGLRLIVETEEDCYKALEVVQQLWHELPGRFKDYIVYPKFNGYQSLHTVVTGEGTIPLEVQIRTKEMHLQAEYGFAAHWRYKEGDCKHSSFVLQMVEWARWVISWQCEAMSKDSSSVGIGDAIKPPCTFPTHSKDCMYSCKPHCGSDGPVFVIIIENDKMSVQEFPANSSVMDVLERAGRGRSRWTSYGLPVKEELRPRLNHEPVSDPNRKLKMGDVVELTPTIPDKSLTVYREEIQRMYDKGLTKSNAVPSTANSTASSRS